MSNTRYYTGIGSRSTPEPILTQIKDIAAVLEQLGYTLRSGGATGADAAFEAGVSDPKNKVILRPRHSTSAAEELAAKIHPMWSACNEHARKLHGRNVQLVLGELLDIPSEFLIAYTKDGVAQGGTRTGLVLAHQRDIPTFNLAIREDIIRLGAFLNTLRKQ